MGSTSGLRHLSRLAPALTMFTLGVILARAGSKGLANKHLIDLLGRPVVAYTIEHALASRLSGIVVSTDCPGVKSIARARGLRVIDRPSELARDDSSVQDALLHAVDAIEASGHPRVDAVVVLYGNVPVRPDGLIDRGIELLRNSGCDSVRSFCPVGKWHPAWMSRIDGDRVVHMAGQGTHRRQDLEAMFLHDGGMLASSRASLERGREDRSNPHAFFGVDRRAVLTAAGEVVEIDSPADLRLAEASLRSRDPRPTNALLRIAGREVGPLTRPFVIAEIGVNHDGSVERAMELVGHAAAAGAEAVKLQLFSADRLVRVGTETAGYQRAAGSGDSQHALLRRLELSASAVEQVVRCIRQAGLKPLATPFSIEDVDLIESLDLPAIKIASPDLTNLPLIRRAMKSGKPLLLSTGASTTKEIEQAMGWVADHPCMLMHCVSSYPVSAAEARIECVSYLRDWFGTDVGYSDHTTDHASALLAVSRGACAFERHLTHDRSAAGPDHAASDDPATFRRYVEAINDLHRQIYRVGREPLPVEADVRRLSRQSLVVSRAIEVGADIGEADLTTRRPADGISPAELGRVVGSRAARRIAAGTTLQWDMLHAKA
jgi:sialic acid synthase SpsE/CMP-N-acetylneuraminic acid synthetase